MPLDHPALIIFDFDGVLCRAETFTPEAIRLGLRRFGERVGVAIDEPPVETLLLTLGYPSYETYPPLLPEPVRDRWREMHHLTLAAMAERIRALGPGGCLYDGATTLLDDLLADGRRLALASNSSAFYQAVHTEVHGLERWFSRLYHAETEGIRSKADMVARILAEEPARPAVMVGDRLSDRRAAELNGLPFVACRYGFGCADEWHGAVAYADDLAGLRSILGLNP